MLRQFFLLSRTFLQDDSVCNCLIHIRVDANMRTRVDRVWVTDCLVKVVGEYYVRKE